MTMGNRISEYRKKLGLTQDALAQKLNVSNQAVSKWESDQCCPDIQLLPRLADEFAITLDELFGRSKPVEEAPCKIGDLPWKDDEVLRVVMYLGRRLVASCENKEGLSIGYPQQVEAVRSVASVQCGDVGKDVCCAGSVTCGEVGGNVSCGDVQGNVNAGGNVKCGDVYGNVDTGTDVRCGNVSEAVTAVASVFCINVHGSVDAGGKVSCADVYGNVDAGENVICGHVSEDVSAVGSVRCFNVHGSVDAGRDVRCSNVSGDVDAGDCVECGAVDGDIDAGGSVTIKS